MKGGSKMLEQNKSVQMFIEAINSDAVNKCTEIENEIRNYEQKELDSAKKEAEEKADDFRKYEEERILSEISREQSAKANAAKMKLTEKRNEITQNVLKEAEERIIEFANSDAYEKFLKKSAKNLAEEFYKENFKICIRKADEKYIKMLEKFGKVQIDNSIVLGGIKLKFKSVTADDTLDKRLKEKAENFKSTCKLNIN